MLAVDPATGFVERTLADDAVYSSLCPAPDGTALYALRSAIDAPPHPVRLDAGAERPGAGRAGFAGSGARAAG